MKPTIWKNIVYFGNARVVGCDAQCDKAWGINQRARIEFGEEDDYAFLADSEVGTAPVDPGTYEGGHAKPTSRPMTGAAMNKWCARECERSKMVDHLDDLSVDDWSQRVYNIPSRHPA